MPKPTKTILTKKAFQDLQTELEHLLNEERPKVIAEIKAAREQGDLSENADYEAARHNQGLLEIRIKEIEALLRSADELKISQGRKNIVKIGDHVEMYRLDTKQTMKFQILGPLESDPFSNIISNDSPIAQAILGNKVGDVVGVKNSKIKFKIEIKKIF